MPTPSVRWMSQSVSTMTGSGNDLGVGQREDRGSCPVSPIVGIDKREQDPRVDDQLGCAPRSNISPMIASALSPMSLLPLLPIAVNEGISGACFVS